MKVVPDTVARQLLEPQGVASAVQWQTGGLSSAWVGKGTAKITGMEFALRRWPEGTNRERVLEVHQVLEKLRYRTHLVPHLYRTRDRSSSVITFEGFHWELADWIKGTPITTPIPRQRILHAASALAELHAASAALGVVRQVPAVLSQRLHRFAEIEANYPSILVALGERHSHLKFVLDSILVEMRSRIAVHRTRLGDLIGTPVPCQWVLRDVHRAHLLFAASGEVSGFIDFDAMRIDTPMTDIARLAGDLTRDFPGALELVVDTYCASRYINAEERVLLKELCGSLPTGAAWTWIEWLALDQLPEGVTKDQAIKRIQGFAQVWRSNCLT
jgi:Ser/Thr protein kinase RdoA (MazF antagonist)